LVKITNGASLEAMFFLYVIQTFGIAFILRHVPLRIHLNVPQAPKAQFGFKQTKAKLCGPSLVMYFIIMWLG